MAPISVGTRPGHSRAHRFLGRREGLCRAPKHRKDGHAVLADQRGLNPFREHRREGRATAFRVQIRKGRDFAAGVGQQAGLDESYALSKPPCAFCRQGGFGLGDGVIVRVDVAVVEPDFFEKRRPPDDRCAPVALRVNVGEQRREMVEIDEEPGQSAAQGEGGDGRSPVAICNAVVRPLDHAVATVGECPRCADGRGTRADGQASEA